MEHVQQVIAKMTDDAVNHVRMVLQKQLGLVARMEHMLQREVKHVNSDNIRFRYEVYDTKHSSSPVGIGRESNAAAARIIAWGNAKEMIELNARFSRSDHAWDCQCFVELERGDIMLPKSMFNGSMPTDRQESDFLSFITIDFAAEDDSQVNESGTE